MLFRSAEVLGLGIATVHRALKTGEIPSTKFGGRRIISELQASLPGYAVPRYVQEIAGQPSKTPLALNAINP